MLKNNVFFTKFYIQLVNLFSPGGVEPSARERRAVGESGEEKRTWLKPRETRISAGAEKKLLALNLSSNG